MDHGEVLSQWLFRGTITDRRRRQEHEGICLKHGQEESVILTASNPTMFFLRLPSRIQFSRSVLFNQLQHEYYFSAVWKRRKKHFDRKHKSGRTHSPQLVPVHAPSHFSPSFCQDETTLERRVKRRTFFFQQKKSARLPRIVLGACNSLFLDHMMRGIMVRELPAKLRRRVSVFFSSTFRAF